MPRTIGYNGVYDKVKSLGGNISGEELIVEYEKTNGGQKTIGGKVVHARENYDNRNNSRKITIDLESHAGDWRLEAINGKHTVEVNLYSLTWERDGFEKVKVDSETRVSEWNGVTNVMNGEDW